MDKQKAKTIKRIFRRRRVRAKISGSTSKPRLSVFRSLRHVYVQLIDDTTGKTLVAASDKDLSEKSSSKAETAQKVGALLADRAQKAGITNIVFDRSGYQFHGRVKALAEGARQGGLKF